jgi:hypothetical protein
LRIVTIAVIVVLLAACTSKSGPEASGVGTLTTTSLEGASTTTDTPGTTATSSTTTTTAAPTTTTTTRPRVTTTTPPTTTTIPPGNRAPTVEILEPAPLSAHIAAYDAAKKDFGAYVTLTATASDPDGDPVEIRWSASTQGYLGTGASVVAWLSTKGSDATQPVITATAADQWGVETATSLQIIVWIPSDT